MKVVYIGRKDVKADNVAGTGLIWTRGQIHEVEDEAKAAKLLEHALTWKDAGKKYELAKELAPVDPVPRINVVPENMDPNLYWEPFVIPVSATVFNALRENKVEAVFMTPEAIREYDAWKISDTAPKQTGPRPQDKETKAGLDSAKKKAA